MTQCINNLAFIFSEAQIKNKNGLYKIYCKKNNLTSSSLSLGNNDINDEWKQWKNDIYYKLYGNFIINLTYCPKTGGSVYAQLVRIKETKCEKCVMLYFKKIDINYNETPCMQTKILQQEILLKCGKYTKLFFYDDDTYKVNILT